LWPLLWHKHTVRYFPSQGFIFFHEIISFSLKNIGRWDEREFDDEWGSTAEILITTIALLFMFLSLCWLVFVMVYWKHEAIKAASPSFLLVIIFGSFFLYGSVFTLMPHLGKNLDLSAAIFFSFSISDGCDM